MGFVARCPQHTLGGGVFVREGFLFVSNSLRIKAALCEGVVCIACVHDGLVVFVFEFGFWDYTYGTRPPLSFSYDCIGVHGVYMSFCFFVVGIRSCDLSSFVVSR